MECCVGVSTETASGIYSDEGLQSETSVRKFFSLRFKTFQFVKLTLNKRRLAKFLELQFVCMLFISLYADIFISAWSKNPYVRGSYSNAVPGVMSEDFHNLQTPVGRLYFAGEGTSEDWWGYGNGAHETGILQANRIWRCLLPKKSRKCFKILPKTNIVTPVNLDSNGDIQKTMTG